MHTATLNARRSAAHTTSVVVEAWGDVGHRTSLEVGAALPQSRVQAGEGSRRVGALEGLQTLAAVGLRIDAHLQPEHDVTTGTKAHPSCVHLFCLPAHAVFSALSAYTLSPLYSPQALTSVLELKLKRVDLVVWVPCEAGETKQKESVAVLCRAVLCFSVLVHIVGATGG